jgi:hypothetical protein
MVAAGRRLLYMQYYGFLKRSSIVLVIIVCLSLAQKINPAPCPCDIYAAGGTPCVAAHSVVRALFSTYNGPLYQIRALNEAEAAALSGTAAVATDHTGYTGTGFVAGFYNSTTAQVLFTVTAPSAGQYSVQLKYSAGNGASSNTGLFVNGTQITTLSCPATASWDTWSTVTQTVTLNAGSNTIAYRAVTSSAACINLDNITIPSINIKDIYPLSPGGYVNTAAVDSFLRNTTGTVSIIYDQSARHNDLTVSLWGSAKTSPLNETPPNRVKDTLSRHIVYPLATNAGEGYRRNVTSGVATGQQAEGMYMVCSGKRYNSGCCWDYGNAESDAEAGGKPTGAMEALYFGSSCWFSPCQGTGPWFLADLEWGLFQGGNGTSSTNTPLPYKYASGFLKGDVTTYTIRANDATLTVLKLMSSTARPSAWVTNRLTGAIILAIGGDSSPSGMGTFYEGAMTIGRPLDTTEDAVQRNISFVYSGRDTVTTGVHRDAETSPAPLIKTRYNSLTGRALISYVLQDAARVSITIIDQRGRHVATVVNGVRPAGRNEAIWDSGRVPAGVYIWRIVADGRDGGAGRIVIGK